MSTPEGPALRFIVVDGQRDFCEGGGLAVPGGLQVASSIAQILDDFPEAPVTVVVDVHTEGDISLASQWRRASTGEKAGPFTLITPDDVHSGEYSFADTTRAEAALQYLEDLVAAGRPGLVVWADHCLLGQRGAELAPKIREALGVAPSFVQGAALTAGRACVVKTSRKAPVTLCPKGLDPNVEEFSAVSPYGYPDRVQPSVLDAIVGERRAIGDPGLVAAVEAAAPKLVVTGFTWSHSVKSLVEDLIRLGYGSRLVLLSECLAARPNFDDAKAELLAKVNAAGGRVDTIDGFLATQGRAERINTF